MNIESAYERRHYNQISQSLFFQIKENNCTLSISTSLTVVGIIYRQNQKNSICTLLTFH